MLPYKKYTNSIDDNDITAALLEKELRVVNIICNVYQKKKPAGKNTAIKFL